MGPVAHQGIIVSKVRWRVSRFEMEGVTVRIREDVGLNREGSRDRKQRFRWCFDKIPTRNSKTDVGMCRNEEIKTWGFH